MSVFKLSRQSGFTLIEILIAITLLAFMTMGVISITQNASDTMERTTEINKNNLAIETALARFEWDFSQIYSPLYFSTPLNLSGGDPYANAGGGDSNFDGRDDNSGAIIATKTTTPIPQEVQEYYQRLAQRFEQNEHFKGISKEGLPIPLFYSPEKNTFEFFTASNRRKIENTKQSHFAWVRYTLGEPVKREEEEEPKEGVSIPPGLRTLVRYFGPDDPYDDKRIDPTAGDSKVKSAVLLENVESLEFQFWDTQRRKWETNLKTIPQGETTLRGVKLLITWYDAAGLKRSVQRIYRNHWPMEVPQDTAAPQTSAGAAAGSAGGASAGATAGNQGGDQFGDQFGDGDQG